MISRTARHRESIPSLHLIAAACTTYAVGALGIGAIDRGFLLMAWLIAGFLAVAIYLTLDAHGRLVNAYTLFFTAVIGACLAGYAIL